MNANETTISKGLKDAEGIEPLIHDINILTT